MACIHSFFPARFGTPIFFPNILKISNYYQANYLFGIIAAAGHHDMGDNQDHLL